MTNPPPLARHDVIDGSRNPSRQTRQSVSSIKQMDFLTELGSSKDIADLKRRITQRVNSWGLSDFSYYRYDLADETPLQTVPEELRRIYKEEDFFKHDMFPQYFNSNTTPVYLSTIEDYLCSASFVTEPIHRNREMLRMTRNFGYKEWYMIPLKPQEQSLPPIFSISSKNKSADDVQKKIARVGQNLQAFGEAIHYVSTTKFKNVFNVGNDSTISIINPRPLQVLQALGSGSCPTLKAVANKLGISIDTVNQHIAVARESLGATSTYNALCIAAKMKLINID